MNELRDQLTAGDPVADEPPLSHEDVQRMRRAIAGGESPRPSFGDLARGSWAAATVVIAVTIAIGMSRWSSPASDVSRAPVTEPWPSVTQEAGARRQVQLIAPGGTRVIWIFNADFKP
jgi:hypothetical protein